MNYAKIKTHDIANGPGVRVSLFVSGCTHRCPGCFNAEAWDFSYGEPFGVEAEEKILSALAPDYIKGFSLLGGEPLEDSNRAALVHLLEKIKKAYPQKTVWCYTGYDFDVDVRGRWKLDLDMSKMLEYIDIMVDGKFIEALKSPALRFRGSANQRIIDVKKSLEAASVVLWKE